MRVALVSAALIGVTAGDAGAQPARDLGSFKSMVLERLDEIEGRYSAVYGTYRYKHTHSVTKSVTVSDRQFCKVGDKYYFVRSGRNLQDPRQAAASEESVLAQTPTYSFWVHRTVGRTDYLLDAFTTRGPEEKDSLRPRIEQENSDIFRAHSIPVMSVTKLFREPKFKITKLQDANHEGRPLVRVHFEAELANPLSANPNRVAGWFGLSEQNGWAVAAYDYVIKNNGNVEYIGSVDYDGGSQPPLVKSVKCEVKFDNKTVKETTTDNIQLTFGHAPREWLLMSTYGLPDPVGVELPSDSQPKRGVYVWLIATAAVLGVLALVGGWLVRRIRATPTAPKPPTA